MICQEGLVQWQLSLFCFLVRVNSQQVAESLSFIFLWCCISYLPQGISQESRECMQDGPLLPTSDCVEGSAQFLVTFPNFLILIVPSVLLFEE